MRCRAHRQVSAVIRAAGGLVWRRGPSGIETAVIRRPGHDDRVLPRTDLATGEHPLGAAVRAVRETTGVRPRVGRRLPTCRYMTPDGPMAVDFWTMRAIGSIAADRQRADEMSWLPVARAEWRLTYPDEARLVDELATVAAESLVLLVRHGSAGDPDAWSGADALRPLDDLGRRQAEVLRRLLPLFGPDRVVSACCARCVDTVLPVAGDLGLPVETAAEFGELCYAADPVQSLHRMRLIARRSRSCVVCSQGAVIPGLVATLAAESGLVPDLREAEKGSLWALSFQGPRLAAADYYPALVTIPAAHDGPKEVSV